MWNGCITGKAGPTIDHSTDKFKGDPVKVLSSRCHGVMGLVWATDESSYHPTERSSIRSQDMSRYVEDLLGS